MNLSSPAVVACLICAPLATIGAQPTETLTPATDSPGIIRRSAPNEVTVTLPPPEPPAKTTLPPKPSAQEPSPHPSPAPHSQPPPLDPPPQVPLSPDLPRVDTPTPPPASSIPEPTDTRPEPSPSGVSVAVRKLESDGQELDPSTIRILAPFPAKPLAKAPDGWRIEPSTQIPPFTQEVELEKGKSITLNVKPHVLVADTDGFLSFTIPEPGYQPSLEYRQNATIGSVLAGSIRQLDEDSKKLGSALEQLEQLLISLPKPKAKPVTLPDEPPSPPQP